MPVVKRYPNRKLYDTQAKQYITLEGIATLVRDGQEVTVVDNATGEDLTALTLTQVIMEQEKKRSGFLPQAVLTGLVRAGGDTVGTLRRTLASSLNLARQVDEEIERRLQTLINRGELATEEGLFLRKKLLDQNLPPTDIPWPAEVDLERALDRRGVPTHADLQQVFMQLDALTTKLDDLTAESQSAQDE
jgi:polyhydroxyalkanoate synthesis repressor PhaR